MHIFMERKAGRVRHNLNLLHLDKKCFLSSYKYYAAERVLRNVPSFCNVCLWHDSDIEIQD